VEKKLATLTEKKGSDEQTDLLEGIAPVVHRTEPPRGRVLGGPTHTPGAPRSESGCHVVTTT